MISMLINKTKLLEKSLDAGWRRNEVIAQNIANIDTPKYKRKKVAFEEYLYNANDKFAIVGNKTDERHMDIGKQGVDNVESKILIDGNNVSMRLDGNSVDIDSEMALLAQNSIKYNALTSRISSYFKKINAVIKEGK